MFALLSELQGYKKYASYSLKEILQQLAGQEMTLNSSGHYSYVLVPKTGDYVYKVWVNDPGYETYLHICKDLQGNSFVPKVLKRYKPLPIFFKRPEQVDGYLNIVKLEKLTPIKSSQGHISAASAFEKFLVTLCMYVRELKPKLSFSGYGLEQLKSDVEKFAASSKAAHQLSTELEDIEAVLEKTGQNIKELFDVLMRLKIATLNNEDLEDDMHTGNFMLRGSQLVIVDPMSMTDDGYDYHKNTKRMIFLNQLDVDELHNQRLNKIKGLTSGEVKTGSRPRVK